MTPDEEGPPRFHDLTTLQGDRWQVPDDWQQGRGAWGGLLVGTAIRAAQAADLREGEAESPRTVREIAVDMLGPVPAGDLPVRVSSLRQGSGISAWRVEFVGDGEVLASASVILGRRRAEEQPERLDVAMPKAPAWRDVPLVPLGPPLAPVFTRHLEFRPISGLPHLGRIDDVLCWTRFPGSEAVDEALLLGMVDALWPATLVTVAEPRPVATMTFAASLLVDPSSIDPAQPLLHRGRLIALRDGYATETRELWTPDGRLAVWNTQVMAIIR